MTKRAEWLWIEDVADRAGLSWQRTRNMLQESRGVVRAGGKLRPWHLPLPDEEGVRRKVKRADGREATVLSPRWRPGRVNRWMTHRRGRGRPVGAKTVNRRKAA